MALMTFSRSLGKRSRSASDGRRILRIRWLLSQWIWAKTSTNSHCPELTNCLIFKVMDSNVKFTETFIAETFHHSGQRFAVEDHLVYVYCSIITHKFIILLQLAVIRVLSPVDLSLLLHFICNLN